MRPDRGAVANSAGEFCGVWLQCEDGVGADGRGCRIFFSGCGGRKSRRAGNVSRLLCGARGICEGGWLFVGGLETARFARRGIIASWRSEAANAIVPEELPELWRTVGGSLAVQRSCAVLPGIKPFRDALAE